MSIQAHRCRQPQVHILQARLDKADHYFIEYFTELAIPSHIRSNGIGPNELFGAHLPKLGQIQGTSHAQKPKEKSVHVSPVDIWEEGWALEHSSLKRWRVSFATVGGDVMLNGRRAGRLSHDWML